jgi:hypothetical protein
MHMPYKPAEGEQRTALLEHLRNNKKAYLIAEDTLVQNGMSLEEFNKINATECNAIFLPGLVEEAASHGIDAMSCEFKENVTSDELVNLFNDALQDKDIYVCVGDEHVEFLENHFKTLGLSPLFSYTPYRDNIKKLDLQALGCMQYALHMNGYADPNSKEVQSYQAYLKPLVLFQFTKLLSQYQSSSWFSWFTGTPNNATARPEKTITKPTWTHDTMWPSNTTNNSMTPTEYRQWSKQYDRDMRNENLPISGFGSN